MIKNKIYYLLLGIGLGIIITSSMNIVFNKAEKIEYTDEQIIEKAKSLGMISIKENIENNDKEKNNEVKLEPQTKLDVKEFPETRTTVNEGNKMITIDSDDTASSIISKLKKNNIIENEERFKALIMEHNLQKKLKTGVYDMEINSTDKEVLKILIDKSELIKKGIL